MKRDADELRALLTVMRGLSHRLLGQRRFGTHALDVLLLVGVAIADAERKPMAAHKLSLYAGVPRPTAVRRLKRLEAKGLVQRGERGRYSLTAKALRRLEAGQGERRARLVGRG